MKMRIRSEGKIFKGVKEMKIKCLLACFLIIGVAAMLVAPALGMGAAPDKGKMTKAETITSRPLQEWIDAQRNCYGFHRPTFCYYNSPNPHPGSYPPVAGYSAYIYGGCGFPQRVKNGTTTEKGYVSEKLLDNGKAEVTVYIEGKNAPLTIWDYTEIETLDCEAMLSYPTILGNRERTKERGKITYVTDGWIDYTQTFTFINDIPVGYTIGNEPLPCMFDIVNVVYLHFVATGYGTFTQHAAQFGFTPGAKGKVQINQIYPPGTLKALPGKDGYPAELIKVIQMP